MREPVTEFIERAVSDYMTIRVEANDMLPITGVKADVMKKVDGLYVEKFEMTGINSLTITAMYYA